MSQADKPDDRRLTAPENESCPERLKSKLLLTTPEDGDGAVKALLTAAWTNLRFPQPRGGSETILS